MSYFEQSELPNIVRNAFTLQGTSLTIHVTDSTGSDPALEEEKDEYKGKVRWCILEERTSKTSKHWRDTLAKELCCKFLFLKTRNVDFTLTGFPVGYHLYTYHVGTGATYDDIRTDAYLCGGGHKFRSPQEALCHFAWLMSGKPVNRCRCIYDDKTWKRKQGPLNKALNAEWKAVCDHRSKERFKARQRREEYEDPVGFNEACFLRPIQD